MNRTTPKGGTPGVTRTPAPSILVTLLAGAALLGGCLYDEDQPCAAGQIFEDDVCKCGEGQVLIDRECVTCDANEVPGDGACIPAIEGLGQACTGDPDCLPEGADTCVDDEGQMYCTVAGCASSSDCPEDWACNMDPTAPACIQGPEGFGTPCGDSEECADFEADYCETLQEGICMLTCTDDPGICPGDWACCDLTGLIGQALCIPTPSLEDGACPLGVDMLEAAE